MELGFCYAFVLSMLGGIYGVEREVGIILFFGYRRVLGVCWFGTILGY